jgi:hypothetical protein
VEIGKRAALADVGGWRRGRLGARLVPDCKAVSFRRPASDIAKSPSCSLGFNRHNEAGQERSPGRRSAGADLLAQPEAAGSAAATRCFAGQLD